jgi:clan AA aspartic protease
MKNKEMGLIYADIELVNSGDLELVRRGYLDIDDVKRMHINILVDTGSYMLAINENIQAYLQLPVVEKRRARLADESIVTCDIVAPIEIKFKNRRCSCSAIVLPGNAEPLLGAIPLEDMDVVINPLRQELTVNPESPDIATMTMKELTII